jgi:hypothetical protein
MTSTTACDDTDCIAYSSYIVAARLPCKKLEKKIEVNVWVKPRHIIDNNPHRPQLQ